MIQLFTFAFFLLIKIRSYCLMLKLYCFVCLFGLFRPTREFFIHMERSPFVVKGCKFCCNFDLYLALMIYAVGSL